MSLADKVKKIIRNMSVKLLCEAWKSPTGRRLLQAGALTPAKVDFMLLTELSSRNSQAYTSWLNSQEEDPTPFFVKV